MDHHVGLRVENIERSIRFWVDGLGGTLANEPVERGGGYFDQLFGPGARIKICYITFDAGAVELFPDPVAEADAEAEVDAGARGVGVEELRGGAYELGVMRHVEVAVRLEHEHVA